MGCDVMRLVFWKDYCGLSEFSYLWGEEGTVTIREEGREVRAGLASAGAEECAESRGPQENMVMRWTKGAQSHGG